MSDDKARKGKKPYRKPRLIKHGSLARITQMAGPGGAKHGSRSDPGGLARTRL